MIKKQKQAEMKSTTTPKSAPEHEGELCEKLEKRKEKNQKLEVKAEELSEMLEEERMRNC